ncbi:HalOD1 output domain-containing protein [Halobaculum sp. EA56]|uniref:HalOD1 output domain-containing protein n=1 Tax=Halobaculum sp. EA56 TaxID=3421648 RepID=UPI003EB88604
MTDGANGDGNGTGRADRPARREGQSRVADESSFRAALRSLLGEAVAAGVDVEGEWRLAGAGDATTWSVTVDGATTTTVSDLRDHSELTVGITDAVCEHTGTDPSDLPPLYDAVDPEVLAAVVDGEDVPDADATARRFVFEYAGHEVVVRSDGTVRVRE